MAKYFGSPISPQKIQHRRPTVFRDAELVRQLNFAADAIADAEKLSNRANRAIAHFQRTVLELEVRQIKADAIARNIRGFFSTPRCVIDKMLELAQLQPYHRILEPSAGSGDLVKAISEAGVEKVDCFEIHPLLRSALQLQQLNVIGANFLTASPVPIYDRILSNPPLGNNEVTNHTLHAYRFLRPGGKLITISHHYHLRPSRSDRQFFNWLKQNKARFLNLGKPFENSARNTSTPMQLIIIER